MKLLTNSNLPLNLDPKLVATALTSIVAYLVATLAGVDLPEEVKAALSLLLGSIVAYFVKPAPVKVVTDDPVDPTEA